jgi:S-adenosyl-L-methionine hydrolase (adenosine-forming)
VSLVPSGVVTLLTDFGTRDPYVGVMKGVILRLFPAAQIVDLTHDIAPQDVREGRFWLERSFPFFPRGTVHVAVVDPGVGTVRRAIVVEASDHLFVGPDNGLLAGVARKGEARSIDPSLVRENPSRTFHGRDVFAPVAARMGLAMLPVAEVGPALERGSLVELPPSEPTDDPDCGVVVTVDRFGNLLTSIEATRALAGGLIEIEGRSFPLRGTYGEAAVGEIVGLVGSFGVLEIALRDGDAAAALGLGKGARVRIARE